VIFIVGFMLGLLVAAVHVAVRRSSLDSAQRVGIFLRYQFAVGALLGFLAFFGHGFRPGPTAARIGWPAHPQFQFELGSLELGCAIATLLCLFIRNKHFWLGSQIPMAVMMVLAGALHVQEMVSVGNFAPYNSFTAVANFMGAILVMGLLFWYFRLTRTP